MNLQLLILAFQVYASPLNLSGSAKILKPAEPEQPVMLAAPEVKSAFPKYFQLSAVSYCEKIYDEQQFVCTNCTDDTASTTMVKAVLNPIIQGAGYVAYNTNDKSIYVVFRGTANNKNWIADLPLARIDAPWTTIDGGNATVILID